MLLTSISVTKRKGVSLLFLFHLSPNIVEKIIQHLLFKNLSLRIYFEKMSNLQKPCKNSTINTHVPLPSAHQLAFCCVGFLLFLLCDDPSQYRLQVIKLLRSAWQQVSSKNKNFFPHSCKTGPTWWI